MNPTINANQRANPTFSLSSRIATSAVNKGAEKLMATALASGMRLKARIRNVCDTVCDNDRITWSRRRRVWNTASPVCGRMNSAHAISETPARVNKTSPTG